MLYIFPLVLMPKVLKKTHIIVHHYLDHHNIAIKLIILTFCFIKKVI